MKNYIKVISARMALWKISFPRIRITFSKSAQSCLRIPWLNLVVCLLWLSAYIHFGVYWIYTYNSFKIQFYIFIYQRIWVRTKCMSSYKMKYVRNVKSQTRLIVYKVYLYIRIYSSIYLRCTQFCVQGAASTILIL